MWVPFADQVNMGSWTDSAIEVSRRLFAVPMAEHSVAVARRLNAPSSIP